MTAKYTLANMDAIEFMRTLGAGSVDLTVTSPPYDNLRTYNGYVFDFEGTARELYRVTKQGGVVVWVVGDATVKGSETGTSFKQALYFKEIGFNLHDTMIYKKVSGACGSNYAYWQSFEFMFVFSKGKPKTINLLRDRKNAKSPKVVNWPVGHRKTNGEKKGKRVYELKEFGTRLNIWDYHTGGITRDTKNGHPAPFPEALAHDHILSWSNEGDLVLDPFVGSGTTGKMALKLNRNFIGCDISQEYIDIAEKRIKQASMQEVMFA